MLLRPCHSFAPLSPDKTCYLVVLPAKVLRTQVHMSSRSSVQNHWHFEHYVQSLCLPALDDVKSHKDRAVIVPHDLISMIHRLVLTTHLEDEVACSCSCT